MKKALARGGQYILRPALLPRELLACGYRRSRRGRGCRNCAHRTFRYQCEAHDMLHVKAYWLCPDWQLRQPNGEDGGRMA